MSDVIRLSAPILLASAALPALPADPSGLGRHVSWVELAKAPHFHYGSQKVVVNAEWIKGRQAIHAHLVNSRGWYPPVLLVHQDKGDRAGDVIAIDSAMIDGRLTMLGALAWNDPDAEAKIQARQWTDVSVGIFSIQDPDTGRTLEQGIGEVSRTTMPHLLGDSRILNAQQGGLEMPNEPGSEAAPLSVEDQIASLTKAMEALTGVVMEFVGGDPIDAPLDASASPTPAITAAQDDDVKEDEDKDEFKVAAAQKTENAVLLAQVADLRARLDATEEAKAKAVFANGCPLGQKFTLTQGVADMLYPLWREDAKALDVVKASMVKDEVKAPQTEQAPVLLTNVWAPSGITDDSANPAQTGPYDQAAAFAEAVTLSQANGTTHAVEYRKTLKRVQD